MKEPWFRMSCINKFVITVEIAHHKILKKKRHKKKRHKPILRTGCDINRVLNLPEIKLIIISLIQVLIEIICERVYNI